MSWEAEELGVFVGGFDAFRIIYNHLYPHTLHHYAPSSQILKSQLRSLLPEKNPGSTDQRFRRIPSKQTAINFEQEHEEQVHDMRWNHVAEKCRCTAKHCSFWCVIAAELQVCHQTSKDGACSQRLVLGCSGFKCLVFLKQMQTQVVLWRVAQCNAQIGCMWKYGNMYTLVYPQMPILMGQMMINQWSWGSWGCPIFQTQMLAPLTWVKSIPRTCPLATAQPTSSKLNSFNFQFLPITSRGPQARTEKMTCYDRKCWLSINHDYPLSPRSHCSM